MNYLVNGGLGQKPSS